MLFIVTNGNGVVIISGSITLVIWSRVIKMAFLDLRKIFLIVLTFPVEGM